MDTGKTSPISAIDVARAVSAILDDPVPHIGHVYNLTGPESADLDHYARAFSQALGRTIRYRNVPNRAGKNLSVDRKKILEAAKAELRQTFGRREEK